MSLLTKCLIFLFLVASDMGLCYDRSNKYRILSVVLSGKGRRLRIKLRGDILEYNNDFERRRAYISSREKLRKRRRTVHITILLIVLGVLLLGIGGLLLFKKGGHLSTQLKNNTSESSAESDPSGDDKRLFHLRRADPEKTLLRSHRKLPHRLPPTIQAILPWMGF